jgi:hypothetical protein
MIASCQVDKGNTVYFWSDTWNSGVLKWKFPVLFSVAKNQNISLHKFLSQDAFANFFTPLSEEVADQWYQLSNLIQNLHIMASDDDHRTYIWGIPESTPKLSYSAHPLF